MENNLQQDTTEIEGCFQTPAQSVNVNPSHAMNCVRCSPHKHIGSDKQKVCTQSLRVECLCDLVTYEHRSMASVQMDNEVLHFTYNSDPNFSRPLPYTLSFYTEFDPYVRSSKMLVINLMIKFIFGHNWTQQNTQTSILVSANTPSKFAVSSQEHWLTDNKNNWFLMWLLCGSVNDTIWVAQCHHKEWNLNTWWK